MKNQNEPAFATSSIDGFNNYKQVGLTKLEYFSIECFKVVAMKDEHLSVADKVTLSINAAKELLKQLENEN